MEQKQGPSTLLAGKGSNEVDETHRHDKRKASATDEFTMEAPIPNLFDTVDSTSKGNMDDSQGGQSRNRTGTKLLSRTGELTTKTLFSSLKFPDDDLEEMFRERKWFAQYPDPLIEANYMRYTLSWSFSRVTTLCVFLAVLWIFNAFSPDPHGNYPPAAVTITLAIVSLIYGLINFLYTRRTEQVRKAPDNVQFKFLAVAEQLYVHVMFIASFWSAASLYLEYRCALVMDTTARHDCIAVSFSVPTRIALLPLLFTGIRSCLSLPYFAVPVLYVVVRQVLLSGLAGREDTFLFPSSYDGAFILSLLLLNVCIAVCVVLHDQRRRAHFQDWVRRKRLVNEVARGKQTLRKTVNSWLPDDALLQISRGETITVRRTRCVIVASAVYDYSLWASRYLPRLAAELLDTLHCGFDRAAGRYGCDKVLLTGELYIASVGLRHLDALPLTQMIVNGISFGLYERRVVKQISRGHKDFRMCVGVHCGAAHGSFIGVRKWIYGLVGPAPEGALALARVGMGHNEVIASDIAVSSCGDVEFSLEDGRQYIAFTTFGRLVGQSVCGIAKLRSPGGRSEQGADSDGEILELADASMDTLQLWSFAFQEETAPEEELSATRQKFLASQVEEWVGPAAASEAQLGTDHIKAAQDAVEVRGLFFPQFAPTVEVEYHQQRQGMLMGAEWAQHVIYFGTAITLLTSALLEETHTSASLGCLIPATLLTIGRWFVAYRWRVHRIPDFGAQLVQLALLLVGCWALKPTALFKHAVTSHAFFAFGILLGAQRFVWMVSAALMLVVTVAFVTLLQIDPIGTNALTLLFMWLFFVWCAWDRELALRLVFMDEYLLQAMREQQEKQLLWHRCILNCLVPPFVVNHVLTKKEQNDCITMYVDELILLDVRFPKDLLLSKHCSSSLTTSPTSSGGFVRKTDEGFLSSVGSESAAHSSSSGTGVSTMSELSTRFRIVEDILNQTPMSSLIGPVHVVGDTMRFAGPMLQPQEPEGRALEKSAVEMRRFLTGRTYKYQRKDSAETAWCMIRFLLALHRAIPGITACAAAESGFGSVLGETQPTFEVVGVVERIVSTVMRAAPVGFVGVTDNFFQLLQDYDDKYTSSRANSSLPPAEERETKSQSTGVDWKEVLATISQTPQRWRLRGTGFVSLHKVVVDAPAAGGLAQ